MSSTGFLPVPQSHLLIDPPSPFASLAEWREFLTDMQAALAEYGALPEIVDAIADAEKAIRDRS